MANNGSILIYHRIIKPFVKKHESELDSAFDAAGGLVKDAAGKGKELCLHGSAPERSFERSLPVGACSCRYHGAFSVAWNVNDLNSLSPPSSQLFLPLKMQLEMWISRNSSSLKKWVMCLLRRHQKKTTNLKRER